MRQSKKMCQPGQNADAGEAMAKNGAVENLQKHSRIRPKFREIIQAWGIVSSTRRGAPFL